MPPSGNLAYANVANLPAPNLVPALGNLLRAQHFVLMCLVHAAQPQ